MLQICEALQFFVLENNLMNLCSEGGVREELLSFSTQKSISLSKKQF